MIDVIFSLFSLTFFAFLLIYMLFSSNTFLIVLEECFEKADRFEKLSAYEVYQPLVSSVSPAYKVEIVVKEKPANQE